MNGYAVQHAWLQFAQEQRNREALSREQRLAEASARRRKAVAWVVETMPDLVVDGRPCGWAVLAALQIAGEARRGETTFSAAAVRQRRRELLERLMANLKITADELGVKL